MTVTEEAIVWELGFESDNLPQHQGEGEEVRERIYKKVRQLI